VGSPDEADTINQRYIRINPDLKNEVPPIFAKEELKSLQVWTTNYLASPAIQKMIQNISHRLVASSFYFEKVGAKEVPSSETYTCFGTMRYTLLQVRY